MTLTIEQVVSLIPSWQGRPVTVSPMTGGLTNTNFRVDVDGTPYFVRIPGAGTELLAGDRGHGNHNPRAGRGRPGRPPAVPCHNDLLAENYIDDGRQLWLIDFEYSGNNDPCFELGNTC